jgi:glutamyl-tRNA synthetase
VVDDADMGITHVVRGDDHLSNVPKQMLLQALLGLPTPVYAHLPLILGSDRARLSKRHGATKLDEFKQHGILPEALVNYLARLGWGFGDQEIFAKQELIEKFTLDKVNKTAAVFDYQKLQWLNKHYCQQLSQLEWLNHLQGIAGRSLQHCQPAVALLTAKSAEARDVLDALIYFESENFPFDAQAVEKHLAPAHVKAHLQKLADIFEALPILEPVATEAALRQLAESLGVKAAQLIHPLRVVLTGRAVSPGIFDVIAVLGKLKVIGRLRRFLDGSTGPSSGTAPN